MTSNNSPLAMTLPAKTQMIGCPVLSFNQEEAHQAEVFILPLAAFLEEAVVKCQMA